MTRRVEFDAECGCGPTHTVTGWESATAGLVVYEDGGTNVPCAGPGDDYPEGWAIWHLPAGRSVGALGFEDPASAMRWAHLMGQYRDFTGAELDDGGPTVWEITSDLDRRGLL